MRILFYILFILWSCCAIAQHNSSYSQYMFNGLLINPAYAGSNDALNLTALYRKQWTGIDNAPNTLSFTAHTPLKNKKVNLGLILINDRYGITEHMKASLIYAYRVKLFRGSLSFGLLGGVDSYTMDWSRVKTTQQGDASFSSNGQKRIYPEAGFGIYYHSQKFFLGLSAPDLYYNTFSVNRTMALSAGGLLNVSDNFKIKPAVMVKYILNSPVDANISSTFYWKDIVGIGVGYSYNTSLIGLLDLKINDQFRIGYSYDYATTALSKYSTGSHEVMLRYLFHYKVRSLSTRYF
jgi:type IX secretion system PorP/SprF family membrane protein